MRNVCPRQDEKTIVIDHPRQTRLALLGRPADELVPGRHPPSGRAKTQASHGTISIRGQVFDLRALRLLIAQIMIGAHQPLEQPGRCGPLHQTDPDPPDAARPGTRPGELDSADRRRG